ncbi:MAG TPA: aminotransferase class I/II-fold pyridoxal phosphate-dependent enzyme, partial [Gemmatimonadales bacterium]|nr:aminotransferase class I/II-fold pyridoxal phosphate-dependent enzyme [Gemmatimonadales bacterium]
VDLIDLGAGDNDAAPPSPVIEAMHAAVDDPMMGKYGFQQGLSGFRRAVTGYMARRFGQEFDPSTEVLPLIGSKEGLAHLPFMVLNPGDVAIVPEPGYQAYVGGTLLAGGQPHVYPLRADEGFRVDLDRVPAEVLARTRLLYVNYPNNPTGAVADLAYLERLVAACRRHDILLAYDNAYCDLTYDDYVAPGIFEVDGAREVAIEFHSLSKSFSMTGWRIGFAAGSARLIGGLTRVKSYTDTGPYLAIQSAAATALDQAEALIAPIREELGRRRDAGVVALRDAGFAVDSPQGAMYLWVPLPAGVASGSFARHALEVEGVVVLPGSAFGPAGEGYFRIALTVGAARLLQAATRLGRSLTALRSGVAEVAASA